jgi:hypothetical protein
MEKLFQIIDRYFDVVYVKHKSSETGPKPFFFFFYNAGMEPRALTRLANGNPPTPAPKGYF